MAKKSVKRNKVLNSANDSFGLPMTEEEYARRLATISKAYSSILEALGVPIDENTRDTPKRVAKMMLTEQFKGLFSGPPKLTSFPNVRNYDQLMTVGPITVKSTCAHHFLPFVGSAYVGILYGAKSNLIGLSKYSRIVDYFARRPQMQEEMTEQIASFIDKEVNPLGVGVLVKASHMCSCVRGVQENAMEMTTTVLRGSLREDASLKQEFINSCRHRP